MATNVSRVSKPTSADRYSPESPSLAAGTVSHRMPLIQFKILAKLASKATDAHDYRALQMDGYDVAELDKAIEALHDAGLVNAFFVNQAARPRFHPSSLTREGRRIYEQYLRSGSIAEDHAQQ